MKKTILCLILALLFSLSPLSSLAKNQVEHQSSRLNRKINQILAEFGENLNVGIVVQDVKTGKTLYQKNADRYFTPASNEKLFTAFATLHYLGPDFV
jgi:serine-type D-Ala-D-Ala carboxypeptidase/endopeptidase (penicillin-binding protein 4)